MADEDHFDEALASALETIQPRLVQELEAFFSVQPAQDVRAITFEIHPSEFTCGSPFVLHLHDSTGFSFDNGPELLAGVHWLVPPSVMDDGVDEPPDLDRWEIAGDAVLELAIDALIEAGVAEYSVPVFVREHDGIRLFHCQTQQWIDEYSDEHRRILGG